MAKIVSGKIKKKKKKKKKKQKKNKKKKKKKKKKTTKQKKQHYVKNNGWKDGKPFFEKLKLARWKWSILGIYPTAVPLKFSKQDTKW